MPVRTRRMKNSGNGVRLPEGSSSLEEDIEMSLRAKSMVDELRSYLDTRIQEKMEALNENARTEPPMIQKDDMTQLLLQILNNQDGEDEEIRTNCESESGDIGTNYESKYGCTDSRNVSENYHKRNQNRPKIWPTTSNRSGNNKC